MPIADSLRVATGTGNGVTVNFPFSFRILSADDIKVTADEVELTRGVHYTVSGVGNNSGSVTFISPPANGVKIVILGDASYSRSTDYQRNGNFLEKTVDDDFDRLVILTQQLFEIISRTLKVKPGSSVINLSLPDPQPGKPIVGNSTGDGYVNADVLSGTVTVSPYMAGLLTQTNVDNLLNAITFKRVATALSRSLLSVLNESVSVFDYLTTAQIADVQSGAKTLDTQAAITTAINNNKVIRFPRGTYLLNSSAMVQAILAVGTDKTLIFDDVTFFVGSALNTDKIAMLISDSTYLVGVDNVRIYGKLTIDGNRSNRSGGANSGMGVYIACSRNILIDELIIKNCPSDGIQVQGDTATGGLSDNVVINKLYCENNYRNGLSCVGTRACRFPIVTCIGSNGASPQAGVDCEPDGPTSPNIDLYFGAVRCTGNSGDGFLIANSASGQSITIVHLTSQGNTLYGYESTASYTDAKLLDFAGGGNGSGDFASGALSTIKAKAMITFDGTGTPAVIGTPVNFSSSIVDNGVGDYTLTISTGIFSSGGEIKFIGNSIEIGGSPTSVNIHPLWAGGATSLRIKVSNAASGGTVVDSSRITVVLL